jgi:hypothetical protein
MDDIGRYALAVHGADKHGAPYPQWRPKSKAKASVELRSANVGYTRTAAGRRKKKRG